MPLILRERIKGCAFAAFFHRRGRRKVENEICSNFSKCRIQACPPPPFFASRNKTSKTFFKEKATRSFFLSVRKQRKQMNEKKILTHRFRSVFGRLARIPLQVAQERCYVRTFVWRHNIGISPVVVYCTNEARSSLTFYLYTSFFQLRNYMRFA